MKNSRNLFLLIAAVVVIALGGYLILGGKMNVSPEDAAGSGIEGIKKASKYKGKKGGTVDLDGAEVQQLLQNDDFQTLMADESFRELMRSAELSAAIDKNENFFDVVSRKEFAALEADGKLERSATSLEAFKDETVHELLTKEEFYALNKRDDWQSLIGEKDVQDALSKSAVYDAISKPDLREMYMDGKMQSLLADPSFRELAGNKDFAAFCGDEKVHDKATSGDFEGVSKADARYENLSKDPNFQKISRDDDFAKMLTNTKFAGTVESGAVKDIASCEHCRKVLSDGRISELANSAEFKRMSESLAFKELLQRSASLVALKRTATQSLLGDKNFQKIAQEVPDAVKVMASRELASLMEMPMFKRHATSLEFTKLAKNATFSDLMKRNMYASLEDMAFKRNPSLANSKDLEKRGSESLQGDKLQKRGSESLQGDKLQKRGSESLQGEKQ